MFNRTALCIALSLSVELISAQTISDIRAATPKSAYAQDTRGVIVRDPFGLCWRTGYWTPADALPGCDGELVSPVPKATAPEPAAPAMTDAPAVVTPATSTAAAAPAAPAAPAPKRCDFAVTLNNDQTFVFNKAVLNNAAKKRIDDEVLGKLAACAKISIVMITGHADRLGTQQYNQKLSERRANAVAAYLKSKAIGVDIDTLGAGKTQSIKSCDDKLPRKKLIECLAPNRRVVIEARGLAK